MNNQKFRRFVPVLLLALLASYTLAGCSGELASPPPKPCTTNDQCDDGTFCLPLGAGSAQKACLPPTCVVGSCDRGTCIDGQCQNTPDCTENRECLEDNFCYKKECLEKDAVCAKLKCKEGMCNAEEGKCNNPAICEKLSDCNDTSFCDSRSKTCKDDLCVINNVDCTDNGVCDPSTGQCVESLNCQKKEECQNGNFCNAGTCETEAVACARCAKSGNLNCNYDDLRTVTCEEVAGTCETSFDCAPPRVCNGGACTRHPANRCLNDQYEPNNSPEDAHVISHTANEVVVVNGTLCSDDVDMFTYTVTPEEAKTSARKSLFVDLSVPKESLGVASSFILTMTDPDGAEERLELDDPNKEAVSYIYTVNIKNKEEGKSRLKAGNYRFTLSTSEGHTGPINYKLAVQMDVTGVYEGCRTAKPITVNYSEKIQTIGDTIGFPSSNVLSSTCGVRPERSKEAVYTFTLEKPSLFRAVVEPNHGYLLTMGLRTSCLDDASELYCTNTKGVYTDDTIEELLQPGTYYLVVQGKDETQEGTFSIYTTFKEVICEADKFVECKDDHTSVRCNRWGTGTYEVACGAAGCQRPDPDRPDEKLGCRNDIDLSLGDTCDSPFIYEPGKLNTFTERNINNIGRNYNPVGAVSCGEASKEDVVVRVDAKEGETIFADFKDPQESYTSVFILKESCEQPATSCVSYNEGLVGPKLQYKVRETGVYYVVASYKEYAYYDNNNTWTFNVNVGKIICEVGERRCANDDSNNIEECVENGIKWEAKHTCNVGCDTIVNVDPVLGVSTSYGQCRPELHSSCNDAIDITDETSVSGYIEDFSNDYNFDATTCVGRETLGPDATFVIRPNPPTAAGQIFRLKLSSETDLALAVSSSCDQLVNSCVNSMAYRKNNPKQELKIVATSADAIYVVVKGVAQDARGKFTLEVEKEDGACVGGATECDGTKLKFCAPDGSQEFEKDCNCQPGNPPSVPAHCGSPDGTICQAPLPLTSGATLKGSFKTTDKDMFNPGIGQDKECTFSVGNLPDGPEDFYTITLQPDDVLKVNVASNSSDTVAYLLDACVDDSCLVAAKGGEPELVYLNSGTESKEVIVVVDNHGAVTTDYTYDITAEVFASDTECKQANINIGCELKQLVYCDKYYKVQKKDCLFGCGGDATVGYKCNAPSNETCDNALDVDLTTSREFVFKYDLEEYHPDIDYGDKTNKCNPTGWVYANGKDAVFKVTGNPGDTIEVTLDKNYGTQYSLYSVTTCDDLVNNPNQCIKGTGGPNSQYKMFFVIPASGSIYVVVDSTGYISNGEFTLRIDNQGTTFCKVDEVKCVNNILERCNDRGTFTSSRECSVGCDAAAGRCQTVDKYNTCGEADRDVITGDFVIEGDMTEYSGEIDLDRSDSDCIYGAAAEGNEAIFKVLNNQTTNATVTAAVRTPAGKAAADFGIYRTNICAQTISTCGENSDEYGAGVEERITFELAPNEATYIAVEVFNTPSRAPFVVDIDFSNDTCTYGETRCKFGADDAEICDEGKWIRRPCKVACDVAANDCAVPWNDTCDAAKIVPIDAPFSEIGNLAIFSHKYDGKACYQAGSTENPATDGADATYSITAGNEPLWVRAKVMGDPDVEFVMYETKDCGAIKGATCSHLSATGELLFEIPAKETRYLVLDAKTATDGFYKLDIEFPKGGVGSEGVCGPAGQRRIFCDGDVLVTCNSSSVVESRETCAFGCQKAALGDKCMPPTNDVCGKGTEIDLANGGGLYFGDLKAGMMSALINDGCTNQAGGGPDAIYTLTGNTGDYVRVVLNADFDALLYVATDCTDVATSCVKGSYDEYSSVEVIEFNMPANEVTLVVDSHITTTSKKTAPYQLSVYAQAQACSPETTTCKGNELEVCNAEGTDTEVIRCVDSCNSDTCTAQGDNCTDARLLQDGEHVRDNLVNFNDDIYCSDENDAAQGERSAVFKVEPELNQQFVVTLDSDIDLFMYISSECTMGRLDQTCIATVDKNTAGVREELRYIADTPGPYYIVVAPSPDAETPNYGWFDIEYHVNKTICPPETSGCENGYLYECSDEGVREQAFCPGGCNDTKDDCKEARNTDCPNSQGIVLEENVEFKLHGGYYGHTVNSRRDAVTCGGSNYRGEDIYYAVRLDKGDRLIYTFESQDPARVMISETCGGSEEAPCISYVAGRSTSYFDAPEAGIYYIIVNAQSEGSMGEYDLTLRRIPSNVFAPCTPSAKAACDAPTLRLTYCHESGMSMSVSCDSCNTAGDGCEATDGDRCFDPVPIDTSRVVKQSGALAAGSNDFHPAPGIYGPCVVPNAAVPDGFDRHYAVPLTDGQTMTATYMTSQSNGLVLYLLSSMCDVSSCIAQTSVGNFGSVSYTATKNETVYLVVDSVNVAGDLGTYDLIVDVK